MHTPCPYRAHAVPTSHLRCARTRTELAIAVTAHPVPMRCRAGAHGGAAHGVGRLRGEQRRVGRGAHVLLPRARPPLAADAQAPPRAGRQGRRPPQAGERRVGSGLRDLHALLLRHPRARPHVRRAGRLRQRPSRLVGRGNRATWAPPVPRPPPRRALSPDDLNGSDWG